MWRSGCGQAGHIYQGLQAGGGQQALASGCLGSAKDHGWSLQYCYRPTTESQVDSHFTAEGGGKGLGPYATCPRSCYIQVPINHPFSCTQRMTLLLVPKHKDEVFTLSGPLVNISVDLS